MAPTRLQEFIAALRNVFERQAMMGESPVLLTSPSTRPFVRSIVERFRPVTMVLSQNEIHPKARTRRWARSDPGRPRKGSSAMRLKTFIAPSTGDAMQQVREEMGDDAIIVSTRRSGRMVRVTAALDDGTTDNILATEETAPAAERLAETLAFHGVPADTADRLRREAMAMAVDDTVMALAGALDAVFEFRPLPAEDTDGRIGPIMLVGPPGVGKTVTVAKLAARAAPDRARRRGGHDGHPSRRRYRAIGGVYALDRG